MTPMPNAPRAHARGLLLERLRRETADQHRALEETVDIARRLADPAAYRELLAKFHGFYAPLEAKLACSPAALRDDLRLEQRRKAQWLVHDLRELSADVATPPACASLPEVDSWPCALGTMYVLEGSTLGGRHISAMLNDSAIPLTARRFFSSYGTAVGAMWRAFCEVLDKLSAPEDQQVAVENARATFEAMRTWLKARR